MVRPFIVKVFPVLGALHFPLYEHDLILRMYTHSIMISDINISYNLRLSEVFLIHRNYDENININSYFYK